MRSIIAAVFVSLLLFSGSAFADQGKGPTDNEIAQTLIEQSIARYPGPCACPYNRARNGSSCGRRSAYSRPGGYDPQCYRDDVSDADIERYRKAHGLLSR